jgi:uncharacterized protein YcaQ
VTVELSWENVLAWRVERQGIAQRAPAADWLEVVRRVCGLHAQVASSAELTLWARVDELGRDVVAQALWKDRSLVRTWAMRGTLHLLASDELGLWVGAQGALRPRYETASWRKAFAMSRTEAIAVLDAIREALDGPPLTRDELGDAVAGLLADERLGEAVRGSFGTMPKLAAFRGDVCFAEPAGQRVRFTRPDRWLAAWEQPVAPPRAALVAVLRRYLGVYGPATREDFARWFGMPSAAQAGKELKALGEEVAQVTVDGADAGWMLAADVADVVAARPRGTVALLPGFDQYVVAAPRGASAVLAEEHRGRVYRPQGWLSPVLLVDGRIEGVWRHEHRRGRLGVRIEPFGDPGAAVRGSAEDEAARLAAYLGAGELDVSWT